jgi:ABC-type multidrug transport system ATPase subunit
MIIAAKKGQSIIVTTHFLDEADVLPDQIGIIKGRKLITCGSLLFLKHFSVGYQLSFDVMKPIDVSSIIGEAESIAVERSGLFKWHLNHGTKPMFPKLLAAFSDGGVMDVTLELTTLEQVFLETGEEDSNAGNDTPHGEDREDERESNDDVEAQDSPSESLANIWEPRGTQVLLSYGRKFLLVQHFMMMNACKVKRSIFVNIGIPVSTGSLCLT